MRNLLLMLLLANILYMLWGWFNERPEPPGVEIIDESDLGPPLVMTRQRTPDEQPESVGAVLGEGETTDLEAVVGRSCVTIGPFRASADADSAQTQYAGEGMRAKLRSAQGQIFVGHWVQIRNVADRVDGNAILDKLREGGLSDAYIVETEDEGMKISLGLFGDIEGAERIELQAKSLGLDAEIAPRMSDGTVFFVDIALPPGRGAGAIIEKYGEEKVMLREAATCPQLP